MLHIYYGECEKLCCENKTPRPFANLSWMQRQFLPNGKRVKYDDRVKLAESIKRDSKKFLEPAKKFILPAVEKFSKGYTTKLYYWDVAFIKDMLSMVQKIWALMEFEKASTIPKKFNRLVTLRSHQR